ncbi:hypothetical protein J4G33_13510 [Actinotalea sp. BY-33]|uniref:PH domain-containing protein n=1 Tax=Actinotalea soli TaxID=2819234 RepID=A0A939LTQ1_9CELL|nr:hypothetical protein [Actinotalea soli]MBO1752825.1 hypothetical protein [Actinotalea soli]
MASLPTGGEDGGGREVRAIGQARTSRGLAWGFVALGGAHVALQVLVLVTGRGTAAFAWILLTCGVGLALVGVMQFRLAQRPMLIRTDRLVIPYGVRTVEIPRSGITGVEGNVPDRLPWSRHAVVHHAGRTRVLPALELPPVELVPLLRDWARSESDHEGR